VSAVLSAPTSMRHSTATRLRNKAQGCEGRATLGPSSIISSTPSGLRPFTTATREGVTQPRWGWDQITLLTQGSSFLATLGFGTESRWDSQNGGQA
jgi:hypothetical protein